MEYDYATRSSVFLSLEGMFPNGMTRGTIQETVSKGVVQEGVSQEGVSGSDCEVSVIPNDEIPRFYFV